MKRVTSQDRLDHVNHHAEDSVVHAARCADYDAILVQDDMPEFIDGHIVPTTNGSPNDWRNV